MTARTGNVRPLERRYLLHLSCVPREGERVRYLARMRSWSSRRSATGEWHERLFADDCELIAAISPVLPAGSDIRDVFEQIESPEGFFYLLHLNDEQAKQLGMSSESHSHSTRSP